MTITSKRSKVKYYKLVTENQGALKIKESRETVKFNPETLLSMGFLSVVGFKVVALGC